MNYDLVISNAMIYDGTGSSARPGNERYQQGRLQQ
jgi:hypothetical protein